MVKDILGSLRQAEDRGVEDVERDGFVIAQTLRNPCGAKRTHLDLALGREWSSRIIRNAGDCGSRRCRYTGPYRCSRRSSGRTFHQVVQLPKASLQAREPLLERVPAPGDA